MASLEWRISFLETGTHETHRAPNFTGTQKEAEQYGKQYFNGKRGMLYVREVL